MSALNQLISLPSLESTIDFSPPLVAPETPVIDAIALMAQGKSVLVSTDQVVGWLTQQDVVRLVASGVDFRTTMISEVMHSCIITLKLSEVGDITTALSLLRQHNLPLLPIVDRQGKLQGIITYESICQAIETEGKAQAALPESQSRICTLVERAADAFFLHDLNGKIIDVNQRACQSLGYSREELLSLSVPDIEQNSFPDELWEVLSAGETVSFNGVHKRKDNTTFRVEVNLNLLELGKERLILALARNISSRQQVLEALQESEQRFRTLADEAPVLIWMSDTQGLCTFCNETCIEFTGKPRKDFLGNGWLETLHPEDKQNCLDTFLSAVNNRQRFQLVHRYLRADGEYRWLLNTGIPRFTNNSFVGFIGCCTDITERKHSQTALQQALAELELRFEERTRAVREMNRQLIYEMTDRLLVEEQLRQSQEMLQLIMDNIPQSIFWKDTDCVYLGCNRNFAETVALDSTEDIVCLTDSDLVCNQEEADFYRETDLRVMQTDTPEYHIITPHLRKDGKQVWLETNKIPLHDAEGNVMGILGTFEDITARKLAVEALKQSEERFRNLVETSSDLVWEIDENAVYTYVSRKVSDILGYQPQEVLGKTRFELMPPEEAERVANIFTPIAAAQQPFKCLENINIHEDGHLVVLESSGVPIFDAEGKFRGYRGVDRDITERKRGEAVLQQTQQRLQAILDNSPAIIYAVDTQNRYLLVNRQYEQRFNVTQEQIAGKSVYDIWSGGVGEEFVENNRKVLAQGIPIEAEEVAPQADGLHTFLSVKFPLKDAAGVPYAVCGISTDITERKRAEESLRRFGKAIESASDAISMAEITGEAIYLNSAFIQLFEYSLEELQTAGGQKVIFADKLEYENILDSVLGGRSWRGEVTMQTKNSRILKIELRVNAIKDPTGKVMGLVSIYTNITYRLQVEETLRLRDRAISASSNGIVISDARIADVPIIYVNPAFERMTGYSAQEVLGRNWRFLLGADTNQPELEQLDAAIQQRKDCTVVLRNYRKDNSLFWNQLNISPVFDRDGELTHYIGIQTDISDRQQAEIALLVSQERLQYLLSSNPGVIYSCKTKGDFATTFISENVVAMMGYQEREFLQQSDFWINHIHPEDLEQVFASLSTVLYVGIGNSEYRYLHKDGNYRWVYDQMKLVRDDAGNAVEIVGYWTDISSRKELEQELIAALAKEKELNELKSRFVSMTSHEFRTPLSTILSSSELLEHYRHKWTPEKQLLHLHRIQTAVKHMTEMLNDVLIIGKAEVGRLEFRPIFLDLVQYCRQMVEEVQLNSQQHEIYFRSQDEFMPSYMDEKLLGHILSNLLSNAIKYSSAGGRLNFTLGCRNNQAIFTIQDFGIGIPQEDLPRLFESFHRGNNVGNIPGTGLGLAIVKKCVDIHQGEIFVTSELGVGTIFTVSLPLNNQM